jgi:hypothetical protein
MDGSSGKKAYKKKIEMGVKQNNPVFINTTHFD